MDGPASSSASDVHVVSTVSIIRILETIDSLCIDNTSWLTVDHHHHHHHFIDRTHTKQEKYSETPVN